MAGIGIQSPACSQFAIVHRDDEGEKSKEEKQREKSELEQKIRTMELEQGRSKAEIKSLKVRSQS